jgi:hypothetical protein
MLHMTSQHLKLSVPHTVPPPMDYLFVDNLTFLVGDLCLAQRRDIFNGRQLPATVAKLLLHLC